MMMTARSFAFALFAASLVAAAESSAQGTRLLRHPTVSKDAVAFAYGGDLWITSRSGGEARRLTSTVDVEAVPRFSPDGSLIAFSATVGGNTDVYVMPTAGGDPKRLTWHPAADRVRGWTPDGKRVLFATDRSSAPQESYFQLFSVSINGGLPESLPLPRAATGSYSPDGHSVAYDEIMQQFVPAWYEASFWRRYRGGRTHPVSVINLASHVVQKLPWIDSNDHEPMWVGNTIYFISDRDRVANLYAYRLDTKAVRKLTNFTDSDIMNASAGPDAVVFEQAGYIHIYDIASNQVRQLAVNVHGDTPWARDQMRSVAGMIHSAALSPTGVRATFEARGDIFTVPAEKGDVRNLTRSPGAHDRNPAWSPDGSRIAWFSDASGEYQLMIGDQDGLTAPRVIALPTSGYFNTLEWSPDGKQFVLTDNHLNLWTIDVATGRATKVDADTYAEPGRTLSPVWSPDSRWLAYSKGLDSHLRVVMLYSLADGKAHQVTDGMSDAVSPAFDASGRYLYFLASTDIGPRTGWVEMSSIDRPLHRAIYLTVLRASDPSPLLPEAGDDPGISTAPAGRPRPDSAAAAVTVDFAGIGQRIIAVGVPAGDISELTAGTAGTVFYLEAGATPGAAARLHKYDLKARAATVFLEGVRAFMVSADRKKLLYAAGGGTAARWSIVATAGPVKPGEGALALTQLQTAVDPRAEWAEIFRENWRIQREYFYDAKMHGNDWDAIYKEYQAYLPYVAHRDDLGYLLAMMGGELTVGHSYLTGSGDNGATARVTVGLLGADLAVENGRYRITKIFTGENWNPELRAPLSAPGIDVHEGDYLLEVGGRALTSATNPYSVFEGTAGQQVSIRVAKTPTGDGSRVVTVVPVASEDGLRTRAWVEHNRHVVDSLSHGRLAYVWLPNTGGAGYTSFTRYFFAQQNKPGAIIDERYNHGGQIADYILNEMDRKVIGSFANRDGKVATSPAAGIFGPKVMLINESAGSGGDALPYMFRKRKMGTLVGTRTWGGLVGTTGTPTFLDGGGMTSPALAFFDTDGKWAVENEGIAPDITVENTPAEVLAGHDAQLERAVQVALEQLEKNPVPLVPRPAPIDRVRKP
jgi:tricorn protease